MGRKPSKQNLPPALLTVQDVKNFIFEAIVPATKGDTLSKNETQEYFGLFHVQLKKYIDMGLPWIGKYTRKRFRVDECKKWFIANNIPFKEYPLSKYN